MDGNRGREDTWIIQFSVGVCRYGGRMNSYHAAISPSRASDFKQCPLKFRYRVVDSLPEPPSQAALRGTLVHSVLEHLFLVPSAQRTEVSAQELLLPRWDALVAKDPSLTELFTDSQDLTDWLESARPLLGNYFKLENPQFLEPKAREEFVNAWLPTGVAIRGIIDRVDEAPNGAIRVVDYKTGKSPKPQYQSDSIFQMRFYAAALYYSTGILPARTQLVYLGDGRVLTYDPVQQDVDDITYEVTSLWSAILERLDRKQFEPKTGPLCGWCNFKEFCPAFGGTELPIDEAGIAKLRTAYDATKAAN